MVLPRRIELRTSPLPRAVETTPEQGLIAVLMGNL
jgi:hypothetical protein